MANMGCETCLLLAMDEHPARLARLLLVCLTHLRSLCEKGAVMLQIAQPLLVELGKKMALTSGGKRAVKSGVNKVACDKWRRTRVGEMEWVWALP
jgi:hypothetical protein